MGTDRQSPGQAALPPAGRALRTRLGAAVTGVVGLVSGAAPHVLHHAGPIAGAAVLAGTAGTVVFGLLGLLVSVPFLLRLKRRFGSWKAPGTALVVFALAFTVSTLVIGPAIRGEDASERQDRPAVTAPDPHGH